MPYVKHFDELTIWIRSRALANEVYDQFENHPNFSFRNQILAAATSTMNNIAEGFERNSPKDFAHFLDIAKASGGEVRSMLYLADDRGYLEATCAENLRHQYQGLCAGIAVMARSLRHQAEKKSSKAKHPATHSATSH